MSFRFRLQRVLELREKAEQARARALQDANDQADTVRRQQDAIQALRRVQRESLDAASRGLIAAGELQHLSFIIGQLDERLVRVGDDMQEAERIVAEAQAALQAASRDRRVIDRLKERHAERWYDAAQLRDRNHMDEIALTRFTRARASGDEAGTEPPATPSRRPAAGRPTPPATQAV